MAITGVTTTSQIMVNDQFQLSGLSQTNISSINITDENGLDVSECFGIETNIVNLSDYPVTLTGECDTSLEIRITKGVKNDVLCDYTGFTQDGSGLVIFNFNDGTSSDNIHPDCCTSLNFTPEIDSEKCYYVCKWKDSIDTTDCRNYKPTGQQTTEGWYIFNFTGGETVTTVPNVSCCYAYGFIEEIQSDGSIKCVDDIPFNPCDSLEIVNAPDIGYVTWVDTTTGVETQIVPSTECCTSNGFNFQLIQDGGGQALCYNSVSNPIQPEVNLSIPNPCCEKEGLIIQDPNIIIEP